LQTLWFEDLGDGRTRLHAQSLVDSFEGRDAWLASGMEIGVNDGYAKLDELLVSGSVTSTAGLVDMSPADRHRAVAEQFAAYVALVVDWDAPTPVGGWVARDVVAHLIEWFTGFLEAGGIELPSGPGVAEDPLLAWRAHSEGVQALLVGSTADSQFTHPMVGTHRLADAVDRFYTADVFMHTWDLAVSAGRDPDLDPDFATGLLEGMTAMDDVLRASGQFGPAVSVASDEDPITRLMGFVGRDPYWRHHH
jgi:uncharacterized protein (TIGR03086 family)